MKSALIDSLEQDFMILLEEHLHSLPAKTICFQLIEILTLLAYETALNDNEAHEIVTHAVKSGLTCYINLQNTKG